MRTKHYISSALSLVLVGVFLVTPAFAASANVLVSATLAADAFFVSLDETGCVETFVDIRAIDSFAIGPPGNFDSPPAEVLSGSAAVIAIFVFDYCTQTQLVEADSSFEESTFQTQGMLDSASLTATIPVFDSVSGTSFDVFVDLDWVGTGPLTFEKEQVHLQFPLCFIGNSRFMVKSRPAQASGSVSNGTVNYTPNPSEFANIRDTKHGFVAIDDVRDVCN